MNPGLALLGLAVVTNYIRHRLGLETICQWLRQHVPRPVAVVLMAAGFGWLIPHYLRGYPPRPTTITTTKEPFHGIH